MRSRYISLSTGLAFLFFIFAAVLTGCATAPKKGLFGPYETLNQKLRSGRYVPRVNNFMIILDGSGSMKDPEAGKTRLKFSKRIVSRINRAIPDIDLVGGLRTFGRAIPINREQATDLIYWPVPYEKGRYEYALQNIRWAYGESSLDLALNEAVKDLNHLKGNTAVIIVSDGKMEGERPLLAAGVMKGHFGEDICIHAVHVISDPAYIQQNARDRDLLDQVTVAGGCGISVASDNIAGDDGLTDFVERVFLAPESDGDGVADYMDKCPDTAAGVAVDMYGCPVGAVIAGTDPPPKVEATPAEPEPEPLEVLEEPEPVPPPSPPAPPEITEPTIEARFRLLENLLFSQGKRKINPYALPQLDGVADYLKARPELTLEIFGHTDDLEANDPKLSMDRNQAVKSYLIGKGVDAGRIRTSAFGASQPRTSNMSPVGQAVNRRIEFKVVSP